MDSAKISANSNLKLCAPSPDTYKRVYKTETLSVELMDPRDLFMGYNELFAAVYSYNLSFLSSILSDFDHAQIVLGFPGMAEGDKDLQELLAKALSDADIASEELSGCESLKMALRDGRAVFKVPVGITAHQKVYILRAYNGKTRVIYGSPNASYAAWKGDHQTENFNYDDSDIRYDEALNDFEALLALCADIPYDAVEGRYDPEKGNPIITKVKEAQEVLVVHDPKPDPDYIKYCIKNETGTKKYKEYLKGSRLKPGNGMVRIDADVIRHIEINREQDKRQKQLSSFVPTLTFDIPNKTAFIDGAIRDLTPDAQKVSDDISVILEAFSNFSSGDFVDQIGNLQETYFKLLCLLYCSPFHAFLRNELKAYGKEGFLCLPLFSLVTSTMQDSGKTFMIKFIIKTMAGKTVTPLNSSEMKSARTESAMFSNKGCPVFIDEVTNRFLSDRDTLIKNDHLCDGVPEMPMVIMAGNGVADQPGPIRKRVAFFKIDGSLNSSVDRNAYRSKGSSILKRTGDSFYRLYTKYMLEEINEMLSAIDSVTDDWYPDTVNISSRIILKILKELGFDIPPYMRELFWNQDYDSAPSSTAINEIQAEYNINKKAFKRNGKSIIINLGSDKESQRRGQNWAAMLPPEFSSRYTYRQDTGVELIIRNSDEFERQTGIHVKGKLFSK